jgi:hypothetical protein
LGKGSIKQCNVSLKVQTQGKSAQEQISFLHPLYWHGYSFHLGMDKRLSKSPELTISIKRDPGMRLILVGFTVLILLMVWYFPQINKNIKGG